MNLIKRKTQFDLEFGTEAYANDLCILEYCQVHIISLCMIQVHLLRGAYFKVFTLLPQLILRSTLTAAAVAATSNTLLNFNPRQSRSHSIMLVTKSWLRLQSRAKY